MGDGSNTNQNSGSGKHETFEQRGTNVPTQPTVPKMPVKKENTTTNKGTK